MKEKEATNSTAKKASKSGRRRGDRGPKVRT